MRGIRRGLCGLRAPGVVEREHQIRIAGEALGRGDILDPMLRPKPAFVAKRAEPAFCGDACAGEDHDIGHRGLPWLVVTARTQ